MASRRFFRYCVEFVEGTTPALTIVAARYRVVDETIEFYFHEESDEVATTVPLKRVRSVTMLVS